MFRGQNPQNVNFGGPNRRFKPNLVRSNILTSKKFTTNVNKNRHWEQSGCFTVQTPPLLQNQQYQCTEKTVRYPFELLIHHTVYIIESSAHTAALCDYRNLFTGHVFMPLRLTRVNSVLFRFTAELNVLSSKQKRNKAPDAHWEGVYVLVKLVKQTDRLDDHVVRPIDIELDLGTRVAVTQAKLCLALRYFAQSFHQSREMNPNSWKHRPQKNPDSVESLDILF